MCFQRRVELFLFAVAFIVFGWFNQGGGWNQNSRFAEVRAIVDGHELRIDDYIAYQRQGGKTLRRYPVIDGYVTIRGKTSVICWVGEDGTMTPVNGVSPTGSIGLASISGVTCSGDMSFALGHFHPNKPPGLSFVAVPAYFVLSHFERFMHRNPDTWWLLDLNAWLASVFSVGLISAAGVVLAFRIALGISGGQFWAAFWTAFAFGFGTLYFSFATLLFDHDVTAVFLIAAFYCLFQRERAVSLYLAGLFAGMAAITNYVAAVPVAMLGVYLLWTRWKSADFSRSLRAGLWYCAGLAIPFAAICAYNKVCYGSPFALSNSFQNPAFVDRGPVFLGMFGIPNPLVAIILLVSPFRGIFYGAPILLMGVYGLWRMRRTHRAEVNLFLGIAFAFFLVNCSFCGWHAGFACGPRYLIPATAFLILPAVHGFANFPRISAALLTVSLGINFLFTVTDAESPAGVGSLAMAENRAIYLYSPLTEYAAPLFFQGRAWPLLNLLIRDQLDAEKTRLTEDGVSTGQQQPRLAQLEADLRQSVIAGSDDPIELASYTGPVSVNPTGVCEGCYYNLFDPGSPQARWNSFNVGEFWFPGSRWSVVPLLGLVALLGVGLAREAGRVRGISRGAVGGFGLPAEDIG
jgi:hypothetical protein